MLPPALSPAAPSICAAPPAVRLLVGGHHSTRQGERVTFTDGTWQMFTAAHPPNNIAGEHGPIAALDSGAFTDPPTRRLSPDRALDRQLSWETRAANHWGRPWQARALVSYDLLIDETWIAGERHKRRWTVRQADRAIGTTIEAAQYLAGQRSAIWPRIPILSCQGVDAIQYHECATEVLRVAQPGDWLGLGGWCILGKQQRLLPIFHQMLWEVLPLIARAGIGHVHIFGVLWRTALGALLWMADHCGLSVSTDSTAPILATAFSEQRRSTAHMPQWRDNVCWWIDELAGLRASRYYRRPPRALPTRQLSLIEED